MSYKLYPWKWGTPDLGRPSGEITWSMSLIGLNWNSVRFPDLTLADFEKAVRDAFNAWASVANLTFREVSGDDAALEIAVERLEDFSTPQNPIGSSVVGLAGWGTNVGGDGDGDGINQTTWGTVDFDIDQTWVPTGNGGTNLYAVALHEIGHVLGLDHVNDVTEILNPTIYATDLGDGDIAGIRELYGTPVFGTSGADNIDLSDQAFGITANLGSGNDVLSATQGDDWIIGGSGGDTIRGNGGDDLIVDTSGTNTLEGGGDNDVLIGGMGQIDADGGAGNDIIIGGIRNDTLDGGTGNDILRGDPGGSFVFGNDILTAGTGNDILEGGGGADRFVFETNGGDNTIGAFRLSGDAAIVTGRDFQIGIDQVDLRDFGYGTFAEVQSHLRTAGGNTIFDHQDTSITIIGVADTLLSAEDFLI